MRTKTALLATLFCVPAFAGPASAQEPNLTLPDIAVTATRVPTELDRIPAGVTVITRRMIEDNGFNTLTDALIGIPGVRVSPAGGPGGQASIFVRGTNSNHVLVLRDGMVQGQAVTLGLRGLAMTEVLSGLSQGDAVLADATAPLADGTRVRFTPRAAPVAATGADAASANEMPVNLN